MNNFIISVEMQGRTLKGQSKNLIFHTKLEKAKDYLQEKLRGM